VTFLLGAPCINLLTYLLDWDFAQTIVWELTALLLLQTLAGFQGTFTARNGGERERGGNRKGENLKGLKIPKLVTTIPSAEAARHPKYNNNPTDCFKTVTASQKTATSVVWPSAYSQAIPTTWK